MYRELPTAEATNPTRKHIRELAERTSNGRLMRLLLAARDPGAVGRDPRTGTRRQGRDPGGAGSRT
jgi:hypothetical protein